MSGAHPQGATIDRFRFAAHVSDRARPYWRRAAGCGGAFEQPLKVDPSSAPGAGPAIIALSLSERPLLHRSQPEQIDPQRRKPAGREHSGRGLTGCSPKQWRNATIFGN